MGQGVNYVTGDYSRGAAGFWVENGRIVHPVEEVTIAGHLRTMLMGIQAIGADTYNYGAQDGRLGAAVADEGRGLLSCARHRGSAARPHRAAVVREPALAEAADDDRRDGDRRWRCRWRWWRSTRSAWPAACTRASRG